MLFRNIFNQNASCFFRFDSFNDTWNECAIFRNSLHVLTYRFDYLCWHNITISFYDESYLNYIKHVRSCTCINWGKLYHLQCTYSHYYVIFHAFDLHSKFRQWTPCTLFDVKMHGDISHTLLYSYRWIYGKFGWKPRNLTTKRLWCLVKMAAM